MWLFPFSFLALCLPCRHLHLTCDQIPQDRQSKFKLIWPNWSFSRATHLLIQYYSSADFVSILEFFRTSNIPIPNVCFSAKNSLKQNHSNDNIVLLKTNIIDKILGAAIMEHKRLNWNLNFGSLAIGFLLALCLILVIGAAGSNHGRYQCCAAGDDNLAVFVIDTETGQTWRFSRTDTYNFGTPQARKSIRRSITPMVE